MLEKNLDTNVFFSGGAGMFIQYHDIIKPVHLYAIVKMIIMEESFGLPLEIIKDMSIFSIIEWYTKRRYINPLRSLDYGHIIDEKELNNLMMHVLDSDDSIYRYAPLLNTAKIFGVYRKQHMQFPVYVYSRDFEKNIKPDIDSVFSGIPHSYLYGDLKESIKKCDQNFTYIFSDIELAKNAIEILDGTYSHVLLANDYRYNYVDNCKTFRYDLLDLEKSHPYIRTGTIQEVDPYDVAKSFTILQTGGIN